MKNVLRDWLGIRREVCLRGTTKQATTEAGLLRR